MEQIKVLIRIRPFLNTESELDSTISFDNADGKTIEISRNTKKFKAHFDKILSPKSTQKDVFNFIRPCISRVEEGFNCTIMTYGQTGSGKTYTMFGGDWALNEKSFDYFKKKNFQKDKFNFILNKELTIDPFASNNGIIPNLILNLFSKFNNSHGNNEMKISCSYIQIYNEKIYDLLISQEELNKEILKKRKFILLNNKNNNNQTPIIQNPLKIKYNKKNGVILEGVNDIQTPSFYEMFELLRLGEVNRKIRQTNKNEMSSRSHTIFIINLENKKTGIKSKIKLCDLAGSERYNSNEEYNKIHINEMCNINKSLSALGKVINCLSNKKNNNNNIHIPYKESKLTQILEDSLGGNSTTFLIATISPNEEYFDETLNTLKFADRAHEVMTKVAPNKIFIESKNEKKILKLSKEVADLKELLNLREKRGTLNPMQNEILKLKKENQELKKFLGGKAMIEDYKKLKLENSNLKNEIKNLSLDNKNSKKNTISSIPTSGFSHSNEHYSNKDCYIYNDKDYINNLMTSPNNILSSCNNSINGNSNINLTRITKRHEPIKLLAPKTRNKSLLFDVGYENKTDVKHEMKRKRIFKLDKLYLTGKEVIKNKEKYFNKTLTNYDKDYFNNSGMINLLTNNNNDSSLNVNKFESKFRLTDYNNVNKTKKKFYNILSQNYNSFILRNKCNNNIILTNYKKMEEDCNNNSHDSKNCSLISPQKEELYNSVEYNNNRINRYIDDKIRKEKSSFILPKEKFLQSMEKKQKMKTKLLIDEIISGRNNPHNVRSISKIKLNKYKGYRFININNI